MGNAQDAGRRSWVVFKKTLFLFVMVLSACKGNTEGPKKPEGWASVFREMTALQNEHEIEVTKLNQDFQMKYMKLQEQLGSQMSPMMMPPMMAGANPMGGAMSMGAMQQPGSMFGAVPPLPPTPPAAPVYGAPDGKKRLL